MTRQKVAPRLQDEGSALSAAEVITIEYRLNIRFPLSVMVSSGCKMLDVRFFVVLWRLNCMEVRLTAIECKE